MVKGDLEIKRKGRGGEEATRNCEEHRRIE